MIHLKPLENRVIVEPLEKAEMTAGGVILPEMAQERPQEGKVLAIGPGRWNQGVRIPVDVKEGDRILFAKYAGTEIAIESGHKVLILMEGDILAIVN